MLDKTLRVSVGIGSRRQDTGIGVTGWVTVILTAVFRRGGVLQFGFFTAGMCPSTTVQARYQGYVGFVFVDTIFGHCTVFRLAVNTGQGFNFLELDFT